MLPNDELKKFFSKVDSLVSQFKIKCKVVITDPQIFSRVQTRVPSSVVKEIKFCKRTAGKDPSWNEVKKMVVEACKDNEGEAGGMNPVEYGGKR